jgi:hypothetical protein
MSDHIAARLRTANPVPAGRRIDPPTALLAQIAAVPRERVRRRRAHALIRRPVLAVAVVMLLLCGIALAANISVSYFDDAGTKQLPMPVRQALLRAATQRSPTDRLALANTVTAYALTASHGKRTVYLTPFVHLHGFCAALEVAGKPVQASCISDSGALATVVGDYGQPWDLRLAPDMHAILGRLAPAAAGDRVVITFEDGTTDAAPMHGRWFAYAVAGLRTRAGHRPSQLTVVHDGQAIRHRALAPASFNTLSAARALVPVGDGSRGQTAIRRYLLDGLNSRMADGGALAASTDLAATRLVGSLAFGHGVGVSVYAAPVRLLPGRAGSGSIILGLASGSVRPILSFGGEGAPRGAAFALAGGCVCAIPRHPEAMYDTLFGGVPLGVTRVAVRTSDGREHAATIFAGGDQWIWLGRDGPAQRPVMLIGRDAAGATVVTRQLRGRGGFSR